MRLGWAGLGWAGLGWAGLGWAGLGLRELMICGGQSSRGFLAQRILIYTDRGGGEEERKHNNIYIDYLVV